jgi:hypothetical protein
MEPVPVEVARVRGRQDPQLSMLAFIDVETRVPLHHPLRPIKRSPAWRARRLRLARWDRVEALGP